MICGFESPNFMPSVPKKREQFVSPTERECFCWQSPVATVSSPTVPQCAPTPPVSCPPNTRTPRIRRHPRFSSTTPVLPSSSCHSLEAASNTSTARHWVSTVVPRPPRPPCGEACTASCSILRAVEPPAHHCRDLPPKTPARVPLIPAVKQTARWVTLNRLHTRRQTMAMARQARQGSTGTRTAFSQSRKTFRRDWSAGMTRCYRNSPVTVGTPIECWKLSVNVYSRNSGILKICRYI